MQNMAEDPTQQQITLVDDNGEETLYDVLFTFKSEDFDRSYILIYPAGKKDNEEVEIQAYALPAGDDPSDPQGGELQPIQTDKEWDMIESVLNTFLGRDGDDQNGSDSNSDNQ
ncbi:DUF1292 domain-containing protein [Lentilactobacillus raoultii]|uniref:UPF0473 protein ACFQ22_13520 n=1 Tax=Lentilactobacillus raoultii TaxID=1987503 RepID=A0ABW3PWX1_9LACO|nr:DUF1292 domain-containing protein [Lentilactobacillus raoultii]